MSLVKEWINEQHLGITAFIIWKEMNPCLFLLSVGAFSRTEGAVYTWVRAISEAAPETPAGFEEVRRAVYRSGQAAVTKAADTYFS